MLSAALLNKVISVDNDKQQVTVQAGARVQQVIYIYTCVSHASLVT